jgi:NTE family protein
MIASVETMFRRVQNNTRDRLHRYVQAGSLRGFVLPYLGQFDARLPWTPPDLVPRQLVVDYPTDFSPMSEGNIQNLALRGEQLTRLLVDHYCPEL